MTCFPRLLDGVLPMRQVRLKPHSITMGGTFFMHPGQPGEPHVPAQCIPALNSPAGMVITHVHWVSHPWVASCCCCSTDAHWMSPLSQVARDKLGCDSLAQSSSNSKQLNAC